MFIMEKILRECKRKQMQHLKKILELQSTISKVRNLLAIQIVEEIQKKKKN